MKYRKFGKLDIEVSALGFGAMRLPTAGNDTECDRFSGNIFEEEAIKMIRYAIDNGVNYVDTAYMYHDGQSEIVVGKALKDGYGNKVMLATKSPVWFIEKTADFDRYLDEQLKKLQTDYVDFYLLHSLSKERWENNVLKLDLIPRAEAAKKAGKIKHLGFSFHDSADVFVKIVDGYDKWDFCQIQYNYMDVDNQAGMEGLKYAASKGLGVIVMEPLLGGRLANPPEVIRKIFDEMEPKRTPAYWALQWVWNQPEVSVVLSGMSSMPQVEENIAAADVSGVGTLSPDQLEAFDLIRCRYKERSVIPCTACGYCMPCPNNVNIPRNFELYNKGVMYDNIKSVREEYNIFFEEPNRASSCVQCKICEEKCPQTIEISQWLHRVHEMLGTL